MNVTKIDIDRQPEQEMYEQTIRVWFDNGGSIRFVEDVSGKITEQAFTPDDPHTVWDDMVNPNRVGESLREFAMESLMILLEQINEYDNDEYAMLEAITGNATPTPTNVKYEE